MTGGDKERKEGTGAVTLPEGRVILLCVFNARDRKQRTKI